MATVNDYQASGKQAEISPERKGISWHEWMSSVPLVTPEELKEWRSKYGADLDSVAASTGRDRYGLTGTKAAHKLRSSTTPKKSAGKRIRSAD